MHLTIITALSILFLVLSTIAFNQAEYGVVEQNDYSNDRMLASAQQDLAFSDLKRPLYYKPEVLAINGVEIPIEGIGLTIEGKLDVPGSWNYAGWYVKGAKVGEEGNLIVDGHYDTDGGLPAAFWGLKNVNLNDTVMVKDEKGRAFTYKIFDIFYVDITDSQRTDVFKDTSDAQLTLVTCGGIWDIGKGMYNKRLVVKALLLQD